jgi:AraC-like DNA-binding protein
MPTGSIEAPAPLPFIKLPEASLASSNPVDFGAVVGSYLPLHVHSWEHPEHQQPFRNNSGCIRLGEITLLSTWGSAIEGVVEQKCEAQLVVPYLAGINEFSLNRRRFTFRTSCLFLPATRNRIRIHCTVCSGVIISFPPECLLPVFHAIAGPGFDSHHLQAALAEPAILNRRTDPRRDRLQRLLMDAMAFAEQAVALSGGIHPMLSLDDLIRRLIVMLLVPDLLEPRAGAIGEVKPFVHADLVEWMLGHLDQPISLSELEQQSCYSRRALQYAFKQRFGVGPMQWLRKQRLARAKALLEHQGRRLTLTGVAQACGYLSLSSFSRDYQARYGERPSRVQRRSPDL